MISEGGCMTKAEIVKAMRDKADRQLNGVNTENCLSRLSSMAFTANAAWLAAAKYVEDNLEEGPKDNLSDSTEEHLDESEMSNLDEEEK
jgi:hypothetical protein